MPMGELSDPLWAVISERGCEASSLTYDEAIEQMRRLDGEKVHGTCIVTAEAARHLTPAKTEEHRNSSARQPANTHGKA